MQDLLTDPDSASKIAVFQAHGLMENTARLNHLMQYTDTHLAKNLKQIKATVEGNKIEEKDASPVDKMRSIAQSMANLYSAGAGVTGTVQGMFGPTDMTYHHTGSVFGGMDYLNSAERQGIVDVLKAIQGGGKAGKDDVKQGLEIALQGAKNNSLQKEKIHELANKLGITLEGLCL